MLGRDDRDVRRVPRPSAPLLSEDEPLPVEMSFVLATEVSVSVDPQEQDDRPLDERTTPLSRWASDACSGEAQARGYRRVASDSRGGSVLTKAVPRCGSMSVSALTLVAACVCFILALALLQARRVAYGGGDPHSAAEQSAQFVSTVQALNGSADEGIEEVSMGPPPCDQACVESSPETLHKLSAYWDLGTCGSLEDDHNSHWCGGLLEDPDCKYTVFVAESLCASGAAALQWVNVSQRSWYFWRTPVEKNNCTYVYFAQYRCTATTTTTATSTTSTTQTRTSTTSSTSTTTLETEDMFLDRLHKLWPEPENFSCDTACPSCWRTPEAPKPQQWATGLNGLRIKDVCIDKPGLHRVFVIGDWGGVIKKDWSVKPADMRDPEKFKARMRAFIWGVDDKAQQLVANAMQRRAYVTRPDYILNVGDNFYWGGVEESCGDPRWQTVHSRQFQKVYEEIYRGPGIDGIKWLGVLGNHDYGGFKFNAGWDRTIAYTWGAGGRWMTPAQYWRAKYHYPGFTVDYFFVDTNPLDAHPIGADQEHNLCNSIHNKPEVGCGPQGPQNLEDCPGWFQRLWDTQAVWFEAQLNSSDTDWQIVVTHFPPRINQAYWVDLARRHGIDLIVSGHSHLQELHYQEPWDPLSPTAWIVSGGGGGITSEGPPDPSGRDTMYGFYELTLTKGEIALRSFSHGGFEVLTAFVKPRWPDRTAARKV